MVLKWTRTKPEPLKYFEPELNLNPNRYLKRFDTLVKTLVYNYFLTYGNKLDQSCNKPWLWLEIVGNDDGKL